MSNLKVTIGEDWQTLRDRVAGAVRAAEAGEAVQLRQVNFDSFETLAKVLTPKRLELLRHVHRHPADSINAVARRLGRDYRRVHADVQALAEAGLIDQDPAPDGAVRLSTPYDSIRAELAL